MHAEDIGSGQRFFLIDAPDTDLGGPRVGQVLAPGDYVHLHGETEPGDIGAELAEAEQGERLAAKTLADIGLPSAIAHRLVIGRNVLHQR